MQPLHKNVLTIIAEVAHANQKQRTFKLSFISVNVTLPLSQGIEKCVID